MFCAQFRFPLIVLVLASSVTAQETAPQEKPTDALQIRHDYQAQKVDLLKTRLELMKKSREVEVSQAKWRMEMKKLEGESRKHQIEVAATKLEEAKQDYERMRLLSERNVISSAELEKAKFRLSSGKFEYQQALIAAKHLEGETESEALELKRLELQGALEINAVQLELVEAEFHLKELKLALQKK